MKTGQKILIITLLLSALALNAQTLKVKTAVYLPEVDELFDRGIVEYQKAHYGKARDIFAQLSDQFPEHQRITATLLMLGKSYYQLAKYDPAIAQFRKLINMYPKSSYVDDAHFMLGASYYQQRQYMDAVKEFLWLADYAENKQLIEHGRSYAFRMLDSHFELGELDRLKNEVSGKMSSAIVTIMLARQYDKLGNESKAVALIEDYMHDHPDHKYRELLTKYLKKTKSDQRSGELKIGVLLPLSSDFAEQAQRILAGIKFAEYQFNKQAKYHVKLVIKDTEGSVMSCIKAARELALDERVIGIIGELESEKTASIAPIMEYNHIPLIAPVASVNGLAAMSEYLFQVNGDLEQRGTLIAKYATLNDLYFDMSLNKPIEELMAQIARDPSITDSMVYRNKTFATLAPADNYGKEMTDAFAATVDKLGGEIVTQKWYYENTQDLARQFQSMREIGFARTNKDSIIEALTADMTDYQKSRFDEDKITVTTIDAIFMPIYTEDIKYVIPQFAYTNIDARLYGGQYWYDMDELRKKNIATHVDSLVFVSDYYLDNFDPTFSKFRNEFRQVMKSTPEAMECYGYDAALLLFSAIANDRISRESVREYLNKLEHFQGIRGKISFKGNRRVNNEQRLVMFAKRKFQLVR